MRYEKDDDIRGIAWVFIRDGLFHRQSGGVAGHLLESMRRGLSGWLDDALVGPRVGEVPQRCIQGEIEKGRCGFRATK